MSASKIVQSLVSAPLAEVLKVHGFTRKGLVFRRRVGEATQVLQVQCGTGPSRSAKFVFNLGVLHPSVDRALKRRRVAEPGDAECTVRTRVGPRQGRDPWWVIQAGAKTPPSNLAARVEKAVMPWFEVATDLTRLGKAFERREVWSDDMLASFGVAIVLDDRKLAATSLQRAVDSINKTRAERAAQFPKDPFGTLVLKRARKLADEHGLPLK